VIEFELRKVIPPKRITFIIYTNLGFVYLSEEYYLMYSARVSPSSYN